MTRDEKLKQLLGFLEIEKSVDRSVEDMTTEQVVDWNEENKAKIKKFLFDTIISSFTKFFKTRLSEAEIDLLISFFSNKDLMAAYAHYNALFDYAKIGVEFKLREFLWERNLIKHHAE